MNNTSYPLPWIFFGLFFFGLTTINIGNTPVLTGISTTTGIPVSELITNDFIGNDCYETSNFSFFGNDLAIGSFAGGAGAISLENGILLSTGRVSNAHGPNSSSGISTSFNTLDNDADLQQLMGTGVAMRDLAMVEFDFVPAGNTVSFDFVFASEEYCDYIDNYNDAFGFFISGPGINGPFSNGAENIGILPNGNPVSVGSVNHLSNTGFYIGNIPANSSQLFDPDCAGHPAATGNSINEIEYDGYTVKMTATINVQPCQTYHLKIAIADAVDGIYDSAVFLRAGSFEAGGSATVEAINPTTQTPEIQESCDGAYYLFTRLNNDVTQALNLVYNILPNSTATMGLDYENLSGSITIPAGQVSVQLPIITLADDLTEGNEFILLELLDVCDCNPSPVEMIILDTPPLEVLLPDITVCHDEYTILNPVVSGGMPPYSFLWNDNSNDSNLLITNSQTADYQVTVTDDCGTETIATASVMVHPEVSGNADGMVTICDGNTATAVLNITATGVGPWQIAYTLNGNPQPDLSINEAIYSWNVTQNGTYTLTGILDLGSGCTGVAGGSGTVQISDFSVMGYSQNSTCFGANDGSISLVIDGGTPPYSFEWNQNVAGQNPANLPPGNYEVTVTDATGCSATDNFALTEPEAINGFITVENTPNCYEPNGGSLHLEVSGGSGNYQFNWQPTTGNTQNPINLTPGNYTVTIIDSAGCSATAAAEITGDFQEPYASISPPDNLDCQNTEMELNASGSSIGNNFIYEWTTIDGYIVSGENTLFPIINQAGIYEFFVTNLDNGCTASATTIVDGISPVFIEIETPEMLDCLTTEITLNASNSSPGNNLMYEWTTTNGNIVSGENTLTPIVNQSGDYQLIISDLQTNCTAIENVFVAQNTAIPMIEITNPGMLTCHQETLQIQTILDQNSGTVSVAWTTQNGTILEGEHTLSPTIGQAGTYQIIATNLTTGCTATESITIFENITIPDFEILPFTEISCANPTTILEVTTAQTGNFSYVFTNENQQILNNPTDSWIAIDEAGEYNVSVFNEANGCSSEALILVTENLAIPSLEISQNTPLNCANTSVLLNVDTDLGANIMVAWSTDDGHIETSTQLSEISVNSEGIYSVTLMDVENGCTTQDSVAVIADFSAPIIDISTPDILTCTASEVSLVANINEPNIILNWTSSGGNFTANQTTAITAVNTPGIYTVTAQNTDNGCISADSVVVVADATIPVLTIQSADTLTCEMTEIPLIANLDNTGSFDVLWTTLNGEITGDYHDLTTTVSAAGTYVLTAVNLQNDCQISQAITVMENIASPVFTLANTHEINCNQLETSILLNLANSENFTVNWQTDNGNILANENTTQPLINQAGEYSVTVTNIFSGCWATAETTVIDNFAFPDFGWISVDSIDCQNTEAELKIFIDPTANIQIIWLDANGNILPTNDALTLTVSEAGQYKCQLENLDNGCINFLEATVIANETIPDILVETPELLTCWQSEIQLNTTSSNPDVNYAWTTSNGNILTNENMANPTVDEAGIYYLTVTDNQTGCTNSTQIEVYKNLEIPEIGADDDTELNCNEPKYILHGEVYGASYPIDYEWITTDGNFILNQNTLQPVINGPGTYTFIVTNLENGCTVSEDVVITQNDEMPEVVVVPFDTLTCVVEEVILIGEIYDVSYPVDYEWITTDGNFILNQNTLQPIINAPGTYTFIVTNLENGCTATEDVVITQNDEMPEVVVMPFDTLTCAVEEVMLIGENSETNPDFSYEWTTETGDFMSNQMNTSTSAAGIYYFKIINEINGCENQKSVEIFENKTLPTAFLEESDTINCFQPETTLNLEFVENTTTYMWTTPDGNIAGSSDTAHIFVDADGTYMVELLNEENGCITILTTEVVGDFLAPEILNLSADTLTCLVSETPISTTIAGTNLTFNWSSADGNFVSTTDIPQPLVNKTGLYEVLVSNTENGCSAIADITVFEDKNAPQITLQPTDTLSCEAAALTLTATVSVTDNLDFQWFQEDNLLPNENATALTVTESGIFEIQAINPFNGCESTAETMVVQQTALTMNIAVQQPNCLEESGSIIFENDDPTLLFSIDNGTNFTIEPLFENLPAGQYLALAQNTDGCEFSQLVEIDSFVEFNLELENIATTNLGQTFHLQPVINFSEENIQEIIWTNAATLSCNNCLSPTAYPTENTSYQITILTTDGCTVSGSIEVRVHADVAVFAPNVFSPNGDGNNDYFYLQAADNSVEKIEQFQIFDRWGEPVFQTKNAQINHQESGWNGTFRGAIMDNQVLVWWAEVLLINGERKKISGDVTILR